MHTHVSARVWWCAYLRDPQLCPRWSRGNQDSNAQQMFRIMQAYLALPYRKALEPDHLAKQELGCDTLLKERQSMDRD